MHVFLFDDHFYTSGTGNNKQLAPASGKNEKYAFCSEFVVLAAESMTAFVNKLWYRYDTTLVHINSHYEI